MNNPTTNLYTIYNIRSLLTDSQMKITHNFLKIKNKKPFILSRGNIIGHGKYGFHWLGDNESTFEMLKQSISGIFNYNIFGIPMTGADICGFHKNTNDELCSRWHVLGAFYPFARNHRSKYMKDQEPWKLGPNTLNSAKLAIN